MAVNLQEYHQLLNTIGADVTLVAVSKFKPAADIQALYAEGQRDFGENYVQELTEKQAVLPEDVRWHFIGHLQSNKVKYIAPFVYLIQGVDSRKLLQEINRQGLKAGRRIPVLLQMHIASEETKFGLDEQELEAVVTELQREPDLWKGIQVRGLMGMASFSDDRNKVQQEFIQLHRFYDTYKAIENEALAFSTLSMGMSNDYALAIDSGSNMIRVGSLLFGAR